MSTLAEFPCFRQPLGLHGPLFIVSDNMYNIRILNAESGDPLYVLRVPNPHNDLTWNPEACVLLRVLVFEIADNFVPYRSTSAWVS